MKIFWWQGGLHLQPENRTEIDVLMVLWGAKKESSVGSSTKPPDTSSSIVGEQSLNNIAAG